MYTVIGDKDAIHKHDKGHNHIRGVANIRANCIEYTNGSSTMQCGLFKVEHSKEKF